MKKILIALSLIFVLFIPSVIGADTTHVKDSVGALTSEQQNNLESQIQMLEAKHGINIMICFTDIYNYNQIQDAADSMYDQYFGKDTDGVLLLVNYKPNEGGYYISCSGDSTTYEIGPGELNNGSQTVYNFLSNSENYTACLSFLEWLDLAVTPDQYSKPDPEPAVKKSNLGRNLGVAAGGGGIAALIGLAGLKSQLKTEGKKYSANTYIRPNSFNITRAGEVFLYRSVSRVKINRDGGGGDHGAPTHVSSSGGHHSGAGGHL